MTMTAANLLTLSRLLLAPVFILIFLLGERGWALAIFAVAGATDLIDGTVARMLQQRTEGGALLDPLADKVLVQSCFLLLAAMGAIPWWFAELALARDVMIVSGIFYLERVGAPLPYRPTYSSKFATLLQLTVAVVGQVEMWRPEAMLVGVPISQAMEAIVLATAAFILISGVQYVLLGTRILRRHRASTSSA